MEGLTRNVRGLSHKKQNDGIHDRLVLESQEIIKRCYLVPNFGEIGYQIGASWGRKDTGELYLFATRDQSRYTKSYDMELVTILGTVYADGTSTI